MVLGCSEVACISCSLQTQKLQAGKTSTFAACQSLSAPGHRRPVRSTYCLGLRLHEMLSLICCTVQTTVCPGTCLSAVRRLVVSIRMLELGSCSYCSCGVSCAHRCRKVRHFCPACNWDRAMASAGSRRAHTSKSVVENGPSAVQVDRRYAKARSYPVCMLTDLHSTSFLTFCRIMRPNRPHMVFTLEDSIVVGGHFYSGASLAPSLRAGLQEHLYGRHSTHTNHLASEVILYRIVRYFHHILEVVRGDTSIECKSFYFSASIPSLLTLPPHNSRCARFSKPRRSYCNVFEPNAV
jgi:hypothetical protein